MKVDIWGGRAGTTLPFVIQGMGAQYRAGQRVLLLVPEQYTLQAERELVERLDLPGFLDMEVLSPSRLRRRIRETGGRDPIAPLDSRGSSMVISQALALCREDLRYYRRVAAAPSLPDKIVALLTDMRHAGLDTDSLRETAGGLASAAARAKLNDLCLVWEKYEQLIAGRFADESAQQAESLRRLAASAAISVSRISRTSISSPPSCTFWFSTMEKGSTMLFSVGALMKVPPPTWDSTQPVISIERSASRMVVRLTPYFSASVRSGGRRSPGRSSPEWICAIICAAISS